MGSVAEVMVLGPASTSVSLVRTVTAAAAESWATVAESFTAEGSSSTGVTVMVRVAALESVSPSLTLNPMVREVPGVWEVGLAKVMDRRAVWYCAFVAVPVRVSTPVPALSTPEIPAWLTNQIVTSGEPGADGHHATLEVGVATSVTVRLLVTCTAAACSV